MRKWLAHSVVAAVLFAAGYSVGRDSFVANAQDTECDLSEVHSDLRDGFEEIQNKLGWMERQLSLNIETASDGVISEIHALCDD